MTVSQRPHASSSDVAALTTATSEAEQSLPYDDAGVSLSQTYAGIGQRRGWGMGCSR